MRRDFFPMPLASLLALGAASCGGDPGSGNVPPPPGTSHVTLETVASGLAFPLFLTSPPNDADRLFIVEKSGRVRIVANGTLLGPAFLDLSGQVSTTGEQGLLGLAFDPDYASNGRFVVNYTNPAGDTRISVFERSAADPDRADPASEQVLLAVDQPFSNHNGGMLAFGPDGLLYIGLGDGGSGGDPNGNGQSRATLLGKLLRVALGPNGNLSIPPDNPFVGQAGSRGEIWSYGLRNPWRFSFDRSTGDLYIADVGQNQLEEINAATTASGRGRGANYGWNVMEGTRCFSPSSGCDQTGLVLPVLDYDHSGGACSVTGGYVYRGDAIPDLRGAYFYADYCAGWVRSFRLDPDGSAIELRDWPDLAPGGSVTSLGEDAQGELYVLSSTGRVARIVPRP